MLFQKKMHGFLWLFFLFLAAPALAQNQVVANAGIEAALSAGKPNEAENILQKQTALFLSTRQADSLNHYILYTGKVEQAKTTVANAVKKVEALVQSIKTLSPSPAILRQAYIEAGEYFGFAGKNNLAYNANAEALKYALAVPGKTPAQVGLVESNLGTYAQRMGNVALSEQHQREALRLRLSDPTTDAESLYISYNNVGSILYYASKLDSALLLFNKAIETLKKATPTPLNQFYRPALVLNNVSGIYSLQGRTTEAITALQTSIQNLKSFIATKEPHLKKAAATSLQFEATDNLAGIYKELGDYRQALNLLQLSYEQKQKLLGKDDPGVFISQILLGQLYFAMKEHGKARLFLTDGLNAIAKADGDYTFWKADACNTLALLYDEQKNKPEAAVYYEKADAFYEASLQGEYDNIYLEFLSNAALFYAENGDAATALAKATKAYDYIAKTQGAASLQASYQLLTLAEVHQLAGNYTQALQYANRSLAAADAAVHTSTNLLDSVKTELKKPKAILQKAKAEYALLKTKDKQSLSRILAVLDEALSVLERRKTVLRAPGDIGLLMADQSELIRFMERLNADLFKLTNDRSYLNKMIGLHESALYNRIRARLEQNDTVRFAGVPATVQARERKLKAAVTASLEGGGTHTQKMQAYFKAVEDWNGYQQALKKDYPRYYEMRYASVLRSLDKVRQSVPPNTTLVRYFFSGDDLFAFVADAQGEQVFPLAVSGLEEQIRVVQNSPYDAGKTGEALLRLYKQLWAPLAKDVRHQRIIIIPDGILYNLSFEALTPKKITSFKELATGSLLSSHSIAYHYSLFLLEQKQLPSANGSFVAFAPGFNERLKQSYRAVNGGSALPDNSYLSLLPQPFTIDVATKGKELLGGEAFLYEQSTANSFRQNAGDHQVIHIGTHAQSDNLHPQFSRLIFAKEGSSDNNLYLSEIYNCNLSSELAVLTACESGKPGYEDGEGMISLAHAFNYAGSQSVLTGLWKIDEQASARLLEVFYENLLKGMTKDEALRQAKLQYLQAADGRTLSPQYWAGLVLWGDTSPIAFKSNGQNNTVLYVVILLTIFLAAWMFFKLRKRKPGHVDL